MSQLDRFRSRLGDSDLMVAEGDVQNWDGLVATACCPAIAVDSLVTIEVNGQQKLAEVVGFNGRNAQLMPLENMTGLTPGARVRSLGRKLSARVGESLLGRVLDGLGNPIDDGGPVRAETEYPIYTEPPSAMKRPRISTPLPLGVRAIDGLLTVGKGQRIGIFAGSGVGKSTVLGMIARNTAADVNVIALIGERGREVREFIERDLGEEGLRRSVVVVATSDTYALQRAKGPLVAMAIAEYFRDQGRDVLFMMDSLTRLSMAQREIGLARGEPPSQKGYPPSVFQLMPMFLERAGTSEKGTITGLITVLVEGDEMNEPIADTARSILDGHVVLSRALAHRNHYPAIDVMQSVSRVMPEVTSREHRQWAGYLRENLAIYTKNEDLINIGAYRQGSNGEIDNAISAHSRIATFLRQGINESAPYEETLERLRDLTL
ncbi:MAG: FliI/YscN family ATPase [Armatimonadetes bacterium]|nr:FliI/YscN family ATPase [Armatimonadota bacterium]